MSRRYLNIGELLPRMLTQQRCPVITPFKVYVVKNSDTSATCVVHHKYCTYNFLQLCQVLGWAEKDLSSVFMRSSCPLKIYCLCCSFFSTCFLLCWEKGIFHSFTFSTLGVDFEELPQEGMRREGWLNRNFAGVYLRPFRCCFSTNLFPAKLFLAIVKNKVKVNGSLLF